ncbi:chromate transporter [Microbacterium sp. LRZ72]|uniref:chromate transporter n=1 Tax=Microbacterium sp. LRZ72 TaxID=2942481 RepID=UPI0029A0B89F|nr:chromate transporter [Microbacterium sp. LRZ72]MDX2376524.1 chromate transporter [Microbacterium sp. LRZ72]
MSSDASSSPAPERRGGRWHHVLSMSKVGVIGFGGGSALIPVVEKELVHPTRLREGEFVQDTVIANITPGALPVKIAALAGTQLSGKTAAVGGALAVAVPGTAATVALLAMFSVLGAGAISVIEYAALGISAFILYLLAHYVMKVLAPGGRLQLLPLAIAILAFLLTGAGKTLALGHDLADLEPAWMLPELSALGLVLVALSGIAIVSLWQLLRGPRRAAATDPSHAPAGARRALTGVLVFLLVCVAGFGVALAMSPDGDTASLLGLILVSTVSSFGGGEAYVGVADGFFVVPGLVDSATFYGQIVPVANALPGPILVKIAAGVAYAVGAETGSVIVGVALAAGAFLIAVGVCSALALMLLAGYDRARDSVFVHNISTYILPVICGLLASTSVSLLHASGRIAEGAGMPPAVAIAGSIVLAASVPFIHRVAKVPDILLIVAFGALSLGVLSIL